jgi:hypothetical protein
MIPAWQQTILEAKGAWNADGVSRAARAGYCRSCGTVVLRGLDADRAALTAVCDPEPINALGEFLALSVGRKTYDLTWRGRYELNPREPAHIRAAPAQASGKSSVVVAHLCGQPMPLEGREEMATNDNVNVRCPF